MNFGNYVGGTYSVIDDKIICNITEASGEYSPEQEINAKITLKINSILWNLQSTQSII
jgi:hypothetical protein